LDDNDPSPATQQSTGSDFPEFMSPITKDNIAQYPASDDEQTVNTALILFLKASTMHIVTSAEWTLHRKGSRVGSKNDNDEKGYEARVDGYLRRRSDNEILVILETKSSVRKKWLFDFEMQEAAQIAAWISNFPESCATAQDSKGNHW